MQEVGEYPEDVDLLNKKRYVYRDHFDFEEKQFMACVASPVMQMLTKRNTTSSSRP